FTNARNSALVTGSARRRNGAICAAAALPSAGSTLANVPPGRATYSAATAGSASIRPSASASAARISVLRRRRRHGFSAGLGHLFLGDLATRVVPTVQHVGEDVRYLVVGQLRHRRHHRV